MQHYFLRNLRELAGKRAILVREEAQLWDILARDLKREAARLDELPTRRARHVPEPAPPLVTPTDTDEKLFVRILDAARMMGMGRSSLYKEINAGPAQGPEGGTQDADCCRRHSRVVS
jgi:hypothetical protein